MNDKTKTRFNLSEIGDADRHNLCATFLAAVERFYADPVNRKRFERWQQKQTTTH